MAARICSEPGAGVEGWLAPPAAGAPNPVTRVADPGEGIAAFLGAAGAAPRVSFPAGGDTGVHIITVDVGTGAASVPLTCSFTLT